MNLKSTMLREKKQNTKGYILYDSSYMKSIYRKDKITRTENRTMVNRGRVVGEGTNLSFYSP